MGKLNERKDLQKPRTSRSLLAISLAVSLAAFGCTTNQNLGNGTPTRSGPDVRTAPTSGVTTGGETYTPPTPPPMTSSYSRPESLPATTPRTIRRSADEAAAIMAQHQASRGVYLGVVNPGLSGQVYVSDRVQTFVNPATIVNPQLTVNSSISSQPTPAISSGAGGTAGVDATTSGTTAAATIAGTGTTTTTGAAIALPAGTFAGTGTLPSVASSRIPTVTAASVGAGRATGTTAATPATTASTATTINGTTTPLGSVSAPIRVLRGTNGSVTVTNVGTSTPSTTGRNQ